MNNQSSSNDGSNGRISHRAEGGPDLNYLYATNRDEDDSDIPIFVHPSSSSSSSSSSSRRRSKKKNKPKRPVQRGRKKDKRTLRGTTLYLGGEEGPNNKIYCIPGHAERVLCIDTATDEVYPVGPEFDASNMVQNGKFKWLRGIVIGDIIYGLPCHADCILRIDTRTDEVSVIDIPYEQYFDTSIPENGDETQSEAYQERHSPWKYHGGTVSPHDKCIYAVPQYAKKVLRIDPSTEECSFVGPKFEGRCKWYGGVIGNTDGAIYCIPQNAEGVLRIDASGVNYNGEVDHDPNGFDPSSPEARVLVTTHGNYPLGGHKWHGAAASADGTIVSVPNNADNVLCIKPAPQAKYPSPDTKAETAEPEIFILEGQSPGDVATGRHRDDGKYKYLGAMAGTDGHVYCFPSGSERVLQVNTAKRIARSVGPNLRDAGMEPLFQNKWQNGLTNVKEECVYAIPLGAETVLRIKTHSPDDETEPIVTTWKLPLPNKTLEKWEGGVVAENGIIYCMPNNHKAVLQIVPPYIPSREELHEANEKKEEERERIREFERQQHQKEMDEKKAKKEQKRQERLDKKKENGGANQESSRCDESIEVAEEKKEEDSVKEDEKIIRTKKNKPELPSTTPDGIPYKYKTGIATLRSSSHRVKYSLDHRMVNNAESTFLPDELCIEYSLSYSMEKYDFHSAIVELLQSCSPELIGCFRSLNGDASGSTTTPKLDNFVVPTKSLTRKCQKGKVEAAQQYLSDKIASDEKFLSLFDRFLEEVVLPHFKQRLQSVGAAKPDETISFYYQRPPTLRIQPGPARAFVKSHDDAEYGHQNGELNFWLPLSSHRKTGVDLWVESKHGVGDYHPVCADVGEVLSFHGSTCRHYVNANHSLWTRMSLDFRVGVEGFFDPSWQMNGTTADHSRRKVSV